MKKFLADFKAFISRGNVVDMAVGVAVAGAFTAIVSAFTNGFIAPLLALLTNDADLSAFKWILRPEVSHLDDAGAKVVEVAEVAILWGMFVQKIIDFLIIAFVLFLVIKVFARAVAKSKEAREKLQEELKSDKTKAAEEEAAAKAKAAEEAAAAKAAEAAAAEAAAKQAELDAYKAQVEITAKTETLLTEIRDLLKAQKQ